MCEKNSKGTQLSHLQNGGRTGLIQGSNDIWNADVRGSRLSRFAGCCCFSASGKGECLPSLPSQLPLHSTHRIPAEEPGKLDMESMPNMCRFRIIGKNIPGYLFFYCLSHYHYQPGPGQDLTQESGPYSGIPPSQTCSILFLFPNTCSHLIAVCLTSWVLIRPLYSHSTPASSCHAQNSIIT